VASTRSDNLVVWPPTSAAPTLSNVRAADRVRDLERDTRRARSRLHLVIAEAVDQHPAGTLAGKATADA
jgi:hypothetical protein